MLFIVFGLIFNPYFYFMCGDGLPAIHVHAWCQQRAEEIKSGTGTTVRRPVVMGIELRSSGRASGALNSWAVSPALRENYRLSSAGLKQTLGCEVFLSFLCLVTFSFSYFTLTITVLDKAPADSRGMHARCWHATMSYPKEFSSQITLI